MTLRGLLRLDRRSDNQGTKQATEQTTEHDPEPAWIKPAATNPWYLLATIHGTHEEDRERNRLVWNRFMSKWLNPIQRKNLLDTGRYTEEELTRADKEDLNRIKKQLLERGANNQQVSEISDVQWISLSYLKFGDDVYFASPSG